MKPAKTFVASIAALGLMAGVALAQSKTTSDGSDDAGGFVRDAQSEAKEMPAMTTQGNPLMDKTVVTSDGQVVGVIGSVAPEAGNRERIYIKRTEAMGGGIFSLVVPQNYVPGDTVDIGMTADDAKKQM